MTPVHIRFGGYQPPTSVHSKAALPAKSTTVLHGRKNACTLSVHKDPTAYGMYVSGASFRE